MLVATIRTNMTLRIIYFCGSLPFSTCFALAAAVAEPTASTTSTRFVFRDERGSRSAKFALVLQCFWKLLECESCTICTILLCARRMCSFAARLARHCCCIRFILVFTQNAFRATDVGKYESFSSSTELALVLDRCCQLLKLARLAISTRSLLC